MGEIVTVGSAVLDRVYRVSNFPEPDGGAFVTEYTEGGGGVAANVACALSTLGHDTAIVTRVGDDAAAQTIVDSLRDRDVDVERVQHSDGDSSYTLILRNPAGERMIVAGGDAVPALTLDDDDRARLREAEAVFTSAYAPDRVVSSLLEMRRSGAIDALAFDLSGPLSELEGRGTTPETIDELTACADLFVTNTVAARSYLDRDPEAAAAIVSQAGATRVAVTAGADGAYLAGPESGPTHVAAVARDVVDTTGAGDQFTAALLDAWLLDGRPPDAAGRFAARAAAKNCTAAGPRGSLATRADLRDTRE